MCLAGLGTETDETGGFERGQKMEDRRWRTGDGAKEGRQRREEKRRSKGRRKRGRKGWRKGRCRNGGTEERNYVSTSASTRACAFFLTARMIIAYIEQVCLSALNLSRSLSLPLCLSLSPSLYLCISLSTSLRLFACTCVRSFEAWAPQEGRSGEGGGETRRQA